MIDFVVAFITGLTTGGLSCLAVQGGLLTASIAHQVEKDVEQNLLLRQQTSRSSQKRLKQKDQTVTKQPNKLAMPIVLFLAAKVFSYTLLGFLLGALGSMLTLTSFMRGIFQLLIGIFMVGSAMRMFNVHPIFRYFVLEPPSFISRYIRRKAKNSDNDFITPIFLGMLTVLIPCGITQSMMALALGTSNPLQGAALMFAFTLGTTPVFFTLAYLAVRLGEKMEKQFVIITAIAVLILGLVSLDSGLNLMGSPLSISRALNPQVVEIVEVNGDTEVIQIQAQNYGYSPNLVYAKANKPVQLELVTQNTSSCSRAFTIPSLNIFKVLPASGKTVIALPSQEKGELNFTCSMGMYSGKIIFQ